MEPPPLPDGVVIQSIRVDEEGEQAGWRVWADGRHEGRRAGEDWRPAARIDGGGMRRLAAILDDADLAAMQGVHRREAATEHESALWFQIARPGAAPVTVTLLDGARLPALDRLVERLAPTLSGGAVA